MRDDAVVEDLEVLEDRGARLPQSFTSGRVRYKKEKALADVEFRRQSHIALPMIESAVARALHKGVVLADAACRNSAESRAKLQWLDFESAVGMNANTHASNVGARTSAHVG